MDDKVAVNSMVGLSFGDLKLIVEVRVKSIASVGGGVVVRDGIIFGNLQQTFIRVFVALNLKKR